MFHDIFDKLKHYKIYRKMVTSYLLVISITVLTVCITLFALFSSSTVKEISRNSGRVLSQISYSADIIYGQTINLNSQLISNQDVLNFMYSSENDKVDAYKASLIIDGLKASYPYLSSISLYNGTNDTFLYPTGLSKKDLASRYGGYYMKFEPRSYTDFISKNQSNLLSFIIYPNIMPSKQLKCAIIININETYVRSLINDIATSSGSGSSTFVIDEKGMIISHPDSSMFMSSISNESYINSILASNKTSGSFTAQVNGVRSLVTYSQSSRFKWYFVSVQPYNSLLQDIYKLRNITLTLAMVLLATGIGISLIMIGNLYNPIRALLEKVYSKNNYVQVNSGKYDEYELLSEAFTKSRQTESLMLHTINSSKKVMTEKFLLDVLNGSPGQIIAPDDIVNELEDKLKGPNFCVIVFKVDRFDEFKRNIHKDQALLRFAICNIAQELLEKLFRNDALVTEEDEIVALAQFDSAELSSEVIILLHEIQETIKTHFHFTVSISIGNTVRSAFEIQNSYISALEYSKYRIFYSEECIIDREKISSRLDKVSKYPTLYERNLIEALKVRNDDLVTECICEFVGSLSSMSYYQAINYSNQLMLTLLKHFESVTNLLDENFRDYHYATIKVEHAESLTDIMEIIHSFCSQIFRLMDEKSRNMNEQKNIHLVNEAKKFIMNNYQNPSLSLEMVANQVGLSYSYFGKLFKSVAGLSYNDFINNVRLEKAKELLAQTNESVVKICELVGIYNVAYFSTLYKKKFGITPSQFRDQEALRE